MERKTSMPICRRSGMISLRQGDGQDTPTARRALGSFEQQVALTSCAVPAALPSNHNELAHRPFSKLFRRWLAARRRYEPLKQTTTVRHLPHRLNKRPSTFPTINRPPPNETACGSEKVAFNCG